jgi:predicted transcriptional regulator
MNLMATTHISTRRAAATFQVGQVKVPPEVGKLLQEIAEQEDRSVSWAAKQALIAWAERYREGSG